MYRKGYPMKGIISGGKFLSGGPYWKSRPAAWLLGIATLLFAAFAPATLAQQSYSVVNLGALGMSQARGLNNLGQVVGGDSSHALLYSGGVINDIGTLVTETSIAVAINDSGGVVVRSPSTTDVRSRYAHVFLYQGGAMSDLGTPGDNPLPNAMNNNGEIVGSFNGNYGQAACLYRNGVWTNILGMSYANSAYGINGSGQMAINVLWGGYRSSGGPLTSEAAVGFTVSRYGADCINESGQIVGWTGEWYFDTNHHAFLNTGGVPIDLGTLGGTWSEAYAINNYGQIVGSSTTSNGTTRPFIYSGGVMRDLGSTPDLVVTSLEWDTTPGALRFTYTNAMTLNGSSPTGTTIAINDQGQILFSGGLLLTPIAPVATSAKLYWATGAGISDKISNTPIFTHAIPAGFTGGSAPIRVPASNLQNRPTNATHVLLVLNPDNLMTESNTNNNTAALNITQPDLLPASIAWNMTNAGLDFSYTMQPGSLGIGSTTAKFFWANGTTLADKISNTAIFTQNIPASYSGQSSTIHVPASNFASPPTNATHILLVLDPDNVITEGDENNNTAALIITRPDLVPTALDWNRTDGGVVFSYAVEPGNLGIESTTVQLFWANGTNLVSTTPVYSKNIPAGASGESTNNQVAAAFFANPPTNASHVLLMIDPDHRVLESQEANNVLALAIAPPVTLAFKRVGRFALEVSSSDLIDAPAIPIANLPDTLAAQPALGLGVVADGVTPVLLHLVRTNEIDQPAQYQLELSIDGQVLNSAVRQRLRILSNESWTPAGSTMTVNFVPGQVNGFAFVEGIPMEEAIASTVGGDLTVTVKLKEGPIVLDTKTYKVRRPPVVLVHGYNTDLTSWASWFTNTLNVARPGFVFPISYGSYPKGEGKFNNDANTCQSLEENKDLLDSSLQLGIENPDEFPLRDWFFLRYDIVGHSQGGVLTRMLCRKTAVYEGTEFFSRKHPRGRFHRVITIGSPHNGSVIPYYMGKLADNWYKNAYGVVPEFLRLMKILQPKFNPFGQQIGMLNATHVDERAKFHCIRTSIDYDGNFAPGFVIAGLGPERFSTLLPIGSDGVVDLESQGGGDGTKNTTITGEIIAHSGPLEVFVRSLLLPPSRDYDTRSITVASKVRDLLDGPVANFGSFINPKNLSATRHAEIDAIIPASLTGDIISSAFGPLTINHYNFQAQPLSADAAAGSFAWVVDVFGPDGADSSGVTLSVNTNDSRYVSVSVDDSLVVGDVVLYAAYYSTNGSLVLSTPKLVASFPTGAALESVELRPRSISLEVSNAVPLEVWGSFTDGVTRPLFTFGNPQFIFSSTAPSIFAVNTNGLATAVGLGSADLQVTYQGLSNATTLTVVATPMIIAPPESVTNEVGSTASFTVSVSGTTPLAYQWRKDGVDIANETNASTAFPNLKLSDAGNYDVVVANNYGRVTSRAATLTVTINTLKVDLLAYFPFEGDALDVSGNDRDGIVHGALLTTNRFGVAGSAYAFNGGNNIQVDNLDPDVYTNGFSFGAWVRPDDYSGVLGWTYDAGWGATYFIVGGSTVAFRVGTGNPATDHSVAANVPIGAWSHLFITHNSINDTLYLNGAQVGQWTSYPMQGNVSTLLIGSTYPGNFVGAVDEVAVYQRALSSNDVALIYAGGLDGLSGGRSPKIILQPSNAIRAFGASALFSVAVSGTAPLTYQWRHEGTNLAASGEISGPTTATLVLSNLQQTAVGKYDVIVSNDYGSVTSSEASLSLQTGLVPKALLLYLPFDGDALDASGHARNGTVSGAVLTTNRLGEPNLAYAFNGSSSITVTNLDPDDYANGFSFGCWVRSDSGAGSPAYWIENAGWGSTYMILQAPNTLRLRFGSGSPSTAYDVGGLNLPLSEWMFLFATHDTNWNRLYVNGVLVFEAASLPLQGNVSTLEIGRDGFVGAVDEFMVFGRGIPTNEVLLIYSVGLNLARKVMFASPSVTSSSVVLPVNGTAESSWRIERALSVFGPWTNIGSFMLDGSGFGSFQDTNPPSSAGFYRAVQQ